MDAKKSLLLYFVLSIGFALAITGFAVEGSFPSSVNVNGIRILASTFNGTTTDFSNLNSSQIQLLNNVVLEKNSFGKVSFDESINLTATAGTNRIVNFDKYLNISQNLIYIDNFNLPSLEKSVTLSFYGLNFTNPQIINGGNICTTCNLISYSNGNLIFNSTKFTGPYYIKETPTTTCGNGVCESGENSANCLVDCPVSTSGGGGGGGSASGGSNTATTPTSVKTASTRGYDFKIDPTFFSAKMRKGTYYQKIIKVTNNGTKNLNIGISTLGDLKNFVFPEVNSFSIKAGKTKLIRLNIYISNKRPADVYIGKILFYSNQVSRALEGALDVKEQAALFDLRIGLLKKYINPGGRVRANITVINMGDLRNFDVVLNYKIMNFNKKVYTLKKEQFAINRTDHRIIYLDVPEEIPIGNYLFYAKVLYPKGNISASSFDTFTIEKISFLAWVVLILVILILMFLTYLWYKHKKGEMYTKFIKKKKKKIKIEKFKESLPKELPELPD